MVGVAAFGHPSMQEQPQPQALEGSLQLRKLRQRIGPSGVQIEVPPAKICRDPLGRQAEDLLI